MKRLSIFVALSVMFTFLVGSIVQAQDGWEIQLEPMWMDVYGNDEHVGDKFYWKEEWNNVTLTDTYGITYDPINLNMKDKFTLRGEAIYRKNQWGLGLSGWWFGTDDSKSGRVTTPPEETTPTGWIYYENGVRMWDHTIWPVWNDLEPSGMSPVDYHAKNELNVWTADLFSIRALAEKSTSQIDLTFGAKLGSLDNDRNEGQKQRVFIYDYFGTGYHWDNHISLESTSKADYDLMLGPVLGFQGKAKYKRFGIEGFINQSVLFGKVEHTGLWEDVDDIWVVTGPEGDPFEPVEQWEYDYGRFSFSKQEDVALPVTELKLKVAYYITENISVSCGGFYSIWWNAPVSPKYSIPGEWVAGEGSGWRLQKRTLKFSGLMVDLGIRF